MADALVSPAVGGTMWVASAALIGVGAKKVRESADDRTAPLMGVMGAFVLAAQMINFAIPGTGSSGHIAGGMLLAILLGPSAGFLTMASVLILQAVVFADGGLLALGCNIFNLGAVPCFIAYPLVYKSISHGYPGSGRIAFGAIASSIVALQLGALAVVLETTLSGISSLPFSRFVLLMQPIHLAIGVVEGLATAGILMFVWQARPELLERAAPLRPTRRFSVKPLLISFAAAAIVTAGALSWFASTRPDGLEWATLRAAREEKVNAGEESGPWPAVDPATTGSGLFGAAAIFLAATGIGLGLKRRGAKARS